MVGITCGSALMDGPALIMDGRHHQRPSRNELVNESEQPPFQESVGHSVVVHMGSDYSSLNPRAMSAARRVLRCAAGRQAVRCVIVDLSQTDFFGAGLISVLLRAAQRIRRGGGQLVLAGLHPWLAELLQVTKVVEICPVCPDVNAAIQLFNEANSRHV